MPRTTIKPELDHEEKLYVVILNWNRWLDTLECLESVFRSHYSNMHVIVCDNDSQDDSLDHIKSWAEGNINVWTTPQHPLCPLSSPPFPKPIPYAEYKITSSSPIPTATDSPPLTLIQTGSNLGYAGGNNIGLRYIIEQKNADFIWILNNDTVVDPYAAPNMIRYANSNPDIGLIGSQLLYYDQPRMIQGIGGKLWPYQGSETHIGRQSTDLSSFQTSRKIDHLVGASIFLKYETLQAIGMMDESYFMYREETDWCLSAQKKGWDSYYCATAKVWHKESISIEKKSPFHDYYLVRNMFYLLLKFYPQCLPSAMIGIAYRAILPKLIRGQFPRLKAVLRGYLDFIIGKRGPYQT